MIDPSSFEGLYYSWALRQWEDELSQGLARLRSIRSRATERAVAALDSMKSPDRPIVATALVKRFHSKACWRFGTPLTADEAAALASYDTLRRAVVRASTGKGDGAVRRAMVAALRKKLAFLGARTAIEGNSSWAHRMETGEFTLETLVTALDKYGETSCLHRIRDREGMVIADFVSLMSALGLGGSDSRNVPDEASADEVAEDLAASRRWFIGEIKSLLFEGPPGSSD